MMDSQLFPALAPATLSEYSIKIPAPSHLGKYSSHRILSGHAPDQSSVVSVSDLETWKATPGQATQARLLLVINITFDWWRGSEGCQGSAIYWQFYKF